MTKIFLLIGLLFFTLSCNSQTPKKKPTPNKTPTTSKRIKLEFVSFNFGDLPHYIFKDVATGQEMEVEFDNNETGYKTAKEEIDRTCNDEGNCKMSGVKYDATMQYKLVDIYDWNGEEAVKTGKKENRWILIKLTKSANVSTPILPFIGKRNFNIDGGSGTNMLITINSNGKCKIEWNLGNFENNKIVVVYNDLYKKILNANTGKHYMIEGNVIYQVNEMGLKEKGCGYTEYCESELLKND